jgi:hypothetical protein
MPDLKPEAPRDRRRQTFLRLLAAGEPVITAADAANIPRSTLYLWRRDAPRFREAWDSAAELGMGALADRFQSALVQRAVDGVDEPVFHAGKLAGYRKRYSDALLLAGLREIMGLLPLEPTPRADEPFRSAAVNRRFGDPPEGKPVAALTSVTAPAAAAPGANSSAPHETVASEVEAPPLSRDPPAPTTPAPAAPDAGSAAPHETVASEVEAPPLDPTDPTVALRWDHLNRRHEPDPW